MANPQICYGITKSDCKIKQIFDLMDIQNISQSDIDLENGSLVQICRSEKNNNLIKIFKVEGNDLLWSKNFYSCDYNNLIEVPQKLWSILLAVKKPEIRLKIIEKDGFKKFILSIRNGSKVTLPGNKFNRTEDLFCFVQYIGPVIEIGPGTFFGFTFVDENDSIPRRNNLPQKYMNCDNTKGFIRSADCLLRGPQRWNKNARRDNNIGNKRNLIDIEPSDGTDTHSPELVYFENDAKNVDNCGIFRSSGTKPKNYTNHIKDENDFITEEAKMFQKLQLDYEELQKIVNSEDLGRNIDPQNEAGRSRKPNRRRKPNNANYNPANRKYSNRREEINSRSTNNNEIIQGFELIPSKSQHIDDEILKGFEQIKLIPTENHINIKFNEIKAIDVTKPTTAKKRVAPNPPILVQIPAPQQQKPAKPYQPNMFTNNQSKLQTPIYQEFKIKDIEKLYDSYRSPSARTSYNFVPAKEFSQLNLNAREHRPVTPVRDDHNRQTFNGPRKKDGCCIC